jgi:hypothetical protein
MSPSEPRPYRAVLWILLIPGAALALVACFQLAHQRFAVDELTYAHGAWAVAHGELPYRDFFFHHTPLLLQVLAPLFAVLGDDPARVLLVRFAMLIPLAATVWACGRLNRPLGRLEAFVTAGTLLLVWPWVTAAVEIRPDNLAFPLFLFALLLVPASPAGRSSLRPGGRGALAGLLVALAVWASEKVLAYGCVFALGFLVDGVRIVRGRILRDPILGGRGGSEGTDRPFLLGHPLAFLGGFLAGVTGVVLYLALTGSLDAFLRWGVEWSLVHERRYPGFSWTIYFKPFLDDYWPLFPLAAVGVGRSLLDLARRPDPWSHRDLLLIPALVTALLSFTLQAAPYAYSLVPFLGLFAVFTARGLVAVLRSALRMPARPARAVLVLLVTGLMLGTGVLAAVRLLKLPVNRTQFEEWAKLEAITRPEDPVFDAAGRYVTRPHVSFFDFNDDTVRLVLGDRLTREVTEGILATGCTVAWRDRQFVFLPDALQVFLYLHFEPMDTSGVLWIWGRPFERREASEEGHRITGDFLAVRDGRYFVTPEEILSTGRLEIDGRPVTEPVFELERGNRKVVYEGDAEAFHILWLPRDGRRFEPAPGADLVFWPLRHRPVPEHDAVTDGGRPPREPAPHGMGDSGGG